MRKPTEKQINQAWDKFTASPDSMTKRDWNVIFFDLFNDWPAAILGGNKKKQLPPGMPPDARWQ
jgi:hypothetical protein